MVVAPYNPYKYHPIIERFKELGCMEFVRMYEIHLQHKEQIEWLLRFGFVTVRRPEEPMFVTYTLTS